MSAFKQLMAEGLEDFLIKQVTTSDNKDLVMDFVKDEKNTKEIMDLFPDGKAAILTRLGDDLCVVWVGMDEVSIDNETPTIINIPEILRKIIDEIQ